MVITALALLDITGSRHARRARRSPTPRSAASAPSAVARRVGDGGRVTLQTLADALGVSRTTASNAFNRPDQLNPALRERVLALAAELGYAGPDPAGRALRSGRSGSIGVLLTERLSYAFDDPAAVATLRGLADRGRAAPAISLVLLPAPLEQRRRRPPSAVRSALVDACFIFSLPEDHPSVAAALERRLPVVIADTPRVAGVPFVGIADRAGARAAAQHLLELGHRRLGVVSLRLRADDRKGAVDAPAPRIAAYRVTRERLEGYARGITARRRSTGTRCRSTRVSRTRARSAREAVARAARARAAADRAARRCRTRSRSARSTPRASAASPSRAAVASSATTTCPPRRSPAALTTVRQPLVEKGRAAGRMLLEALDGGSTRRRRAADRARRARLDGRAHAVTTAPPRRGSPAPASSPVAGSRRTAWAPPKNTLRSLNGASSRPSAASASASTPGSA